MSARHADALDAETRALTAEHRLVENGRLAVFCAGAAHIPAILEEIGRLREVTFRAVGEGTGQAIDLDRFDTHYLHLFAWNVETREVVGAYRLGQTDHILASHGVGGLYTSTLFRYDQRLLTRLAPAIELGRSFVRAEYQRSPDALLILWRAIAQFAVQSGYRVLFGPVTISRRYSDRSQQLLMEFLRQNALNTELGELVEALNPPPAWREWRDGVGPRTIITSRDLDRVVARLEPDGKGVPVLLRQYLRLNARLLGFNVDPAFGDALDALMMVDLADVDRAILARYAGKDLAALVARRSIAA